MKRIESNTPVRVHASKEEVRNRKCRPKPLTAKLAERCSRGDYPEQVIAASLATYGFKRRLVHRRYVSQKVICG